MRKALIGLIMAATVMTPVAAQAQDDRADRRAERYERLEQRNQQRGEQRQQRQEARQARQAPQQAAPQPAAVVQRGDRRQGHVERRTENRPATSTVGGWQGPRTRATREDAERYDRIARENALRHGTSEQRREIREEQRRDRGDWRQDRRGDRGDWRQDRRGDRRDWRQDRRGDRRDWRQDRRGDRRDWNRDWRRDHRYDWQSWRYRNRNIFRGSSYYSPFRNHRYSRFSIGVFLGQPFYHQRYWIGDPWQYRLPAAPYGTQWVRYYNDVLLVDVYTGEVIDVIYDFFW